MQYIQREIEKTLKRLLKTRKVLMVLGARQVGKTTLMQHMLKESRNVFLNLDTEVDFARLRAARSLAPREALKSFGSPEVFVIDEAQREKELGLLLKGWYDVGLPVKIVVLGSSSVHLLDQIAEALTGRNEKLHLSPLTFREILHSQSWYTPSYSSTVFKKEFADQLHALMMQSLIFGSYPEIVVGGEGREQNLINLATDYVLKDVLHLGLVKSPDTIRRLLLLLAHQVGSQVSVLELARTLQIARQTVVHYIDLLERSFVIFRLPAFSTNQRKEIAKSTKIYFWDTGIRNALLKEFSMSEFRTDIGMLWENWIIAEYAKRNLLEGNVQSLYFWRTTAGSEVDLIIRHHGSMKAFEIKWSRQKRARSAFTQKYRIPVTRITNTTFIEQVI